MQVRLLAADLPSDPAVRQRIETRLIVPTGYGCLSPSGLVVDAEVVLHVNRSDLQNPDAVVIPILSPPSLTRADAVETDGNVAVFAWGRRPLTELCVSAPAEE